jgi:conjugal transfer ATP-binding protein TraC
MSSYVERVKYISERKRVSELLPTLAYHEETQAFFIEDGYLGIAWNASLLVGFDESVTSVLSSLLGDEFPSDAFVSFHLMSFNEIENLLSIYDHARTELRFHNHLTKSQKDTLENMYKRRVDFVRSGISKALIESSGVMLKNNELVVTIKIPCQKIPTDKDFQNIQSSAIKVEQAMVSQDMAPTRLDAGEFINMMSAIFRMGEHQNKVYDDQKFINEQIVDYEDDLEVISRDCLRVNKKYVKSLSFKQYPKQTSLGYMNYLIGDPHGGSQQIKDPFMLTAMFYLPERVPSTQTLKQKGQKIIWQAEGAFGKLSPRLISKGEGFRILEQSFENGGSPVGVWLNLTVFCDSLDAAEKSAQQIKTNYSVHGYSIAQDRYYMLPSFVSSLPFGVTKHSVKESFRFHTMTNLEAAHLTPIMGDWKGNGTKAGCILFSRRGQVCFWDPFDSETSFNAFIFATSGSGKSFFANDLIMGQMQRGALIRIIDQGRSYERLAKAMEGEFIAFSERDKQIILNPFTHVQDIKKEMEMLKLILSLIAGPRDGLDDKQMAYLEEAVLQVWDENRNRTSITDIHEYLLSKADTENKDGTRVQSLYDLGMQFYPYTRHGSFGHFMDGDCNLDYDNALVCLELGELHERKSLQSVVLLQLLMHIQRECLKDKSQPKIVLIDESFELLTNPVVSAFIIRFFRQIRKLNGSAIIISQSMQDVYQNKSTAAIAENTSNLLVLNQKPEAIEGLRKTGRLEMTDYGYDLLKSVHTVKGKYSEIFIRTDRGEGIVRLVVDRFTQLLYSTNASEVAQLDRMMDSGMSVSEAINEYIRLEKQNKVA